MTCGRCTGERWVCEEHDDRGWPEHCECGAGMPCPDCNPQDYDEHGTPLMPLDEDGQRIVANLLYLPRVGGLS